MPRPFTLQKMRNDKTGKSVYGLCVKTWSESNLMELRAYIGRSFVVKPVRTAVKSRPKDTVLTFALFEGDKYIARTGDFLSKDSGSFKVIPRDRINHQN